MVFSISDSLWLVAERLFTIPRKLKSGTVKRNCKEYHGTRSSKVCNCTKSF